MFKGSAEPVGPFFSFKVLSMLYITPTLSIDEDDIQEEFIRASGPGGQNVNKVATAVQLRFDVSGSTSLPDDVRARLTRLAGRRITKEGVLIIRAHRFRTQEQNRRDALERLIGLIRSAAEKPRHSSQDQADTGIEGTSPGSQATAQHA